MNKKKLPSKPSKLIRLALQDLKKAERHPQYKVNMSLWHSPTANDKCAVCLAGSVMAFSLKVDRYRHVVPLSLGKNLHTRLLALNEFRIGEVDTALNLLGISAHKRRSLRPKYVIPEYKPNDTKFQRAMRRMANRLEKVGL